MRKKASKSSNGNVGLLLSQAREHLDDMFVSLCTETPGDSPIERMLLIALSMRTLIFKSPGGLRGMVFSRSDAQTEDFKQTLAPQALIVQGQRQIAGWRVDFLILVYRGGTWRSLIVECDGHDFHERTKEQAARDRARDRAAQMDGHVVFRFTGAEIWSDPWGCAGRIIEWATLS